MDNNKSLHQNGTNGAIGHHGQGPDEDLRNKKLDDVTSPNGNVNKDTVHMERTIGLFGGIALILGTMIGTGIFVSPKNLLKNTNSAAMSLIVWAACGGLATLASLSYCELGTVVPRSGGEHAYYMATFPPLNRFFGEIPGFLFAWTTVLLLKPSSLAIISLAFGKYVLWPILSMEKYGKDFQNSEDFTLAVKLLAAVIASAIAAVNIFSAKLATKAAIVFLIAKISTMAIMIGIGIYNISRGEYGALANGWDAPENRSIGDIANSFYSGLWAYDGWNNLNLATEELINPARNLPLSILVGIPAATVLYILINVAYFTALSKQAFLDSEAVAVDVGDQYLGPLKYLIPVLVGIAALGTGNGSMFTAGRLTYVVGRDGHMIDVLSYVHAKRLTPIVALALNAALSYIMIFASDINKLIDLFGFASWIIYGLAIACVVVLRYTKPDAPRPFKVPIIIPIIAVIISIALVVLPLVYDPKVEYLAVVGFYALGVLVYIPFVYKKYRLPFMDQLTHFVQFITLAAPSPYKED